MTWVITQYQFSIRNYTRMKLREKLFNYENDKQQNRDVYLKPENILHLSSLAVADATLKKRGCHGYSQSFAGHSRVRPLAIYRYYPECAE